MATEFKNIGPRYQEQLIKVKARRYLRAPSKKRADRPRRQTRELANADLEKYAKALDQAIMKYHGHKMMEINDTIQNLWQKTYQGTGALPPCEQRIAPADLSLVDIDKIMIKSENESVKSNRSYNYRVRRIAALGGIKV